MSPKASSQSSAWFSLGSALVLDWKHLGRSTTPGGATAWVRQLDGEPIVLRAWGEETTSYYEFLFLSDEHLAGTMVISADRQEKIRLKMTLEIAGLLSLSDTIEFKEHPRTMLLSPVSRNTEIKSGTITQASIPALPAPAAEIFEVSPDGALLTICGEWISEVLASVRDHIRESAPSPQPRSKTEHANVRPNAARSTLDSQARSPASSAKAEGTSGPTARTKDKNGKLVCTTNTGESFDIVSDETYVGRSKQCAIILKSQRVSRKHACITREADGFYINDLGAANGIWAGSEKIDREKIKQGDQYIVGDVVLSFAFA
jgi:hypothetical protein